MRQQHYYTVILLCLVLLGLSVSTLAQDNSQCPQRPSPIAGAKFVQVVGTEPLRVRYEPGLTGEWSTQQIRVGEVAYLIDQEPVCADGYRWWSVMHPQFSGYVAEGDETEDWLRPVDIPDLPPFETNIPTSHSALSGDNLLEIREAGHFGEGSIQKVAWSDDGIWMAVASVNSLWLYHSDSATSGQALLRGVEVTSVVFGHENDIWASDTSGHVYHWQTVTAEPEIFDFQAWITMLAFNPDHSHLVIAHRGEGGMSLKLWDIATHGVTHEWLLPKAWTLERVQFASDGQRLWAMDGGSLYLVSLEPPYDVVQTLDIAMFPIIRHGEADAVYVDWMGNMTTLVSNSADLDLSTRQTLSREAYGFYQLGYSAAVDLLITRNYIEVSVRRIDVDATETAIAEDASVFALNPDGEILAVGHQTGEVSLYSLSKNAASEPEITPLGRFQASHDPIQQIVFRPDGQQLAVYDTAQVLTTWQVSTQEPIITITQFMPPFASAAFQPDGKRILIGDALGDLHLWDLATQTQLPFAEERADPVINLIYRQDGRRFITVNGEHVWLWDAATGEVLSRLNEDVHDVRTLQLYDSHFSEKSAVLWPTDDWLLVHGTRYAVSDKAVRAGEPPLYAPLLPLIGENYARMPIAKSGDGRIWAAVLGRDVFFFESKTGSLIGQRRLLSTDIHRIALSSSGQFLAIHYATTAYNATGWISVMDVATGEIRATMEENTQITILCINEDGSLVITGYVDGTIRVWKNTETQSVTWLKGHTQYITELQLSPDGTQLLSTSYDGTMRLWSLPD